MAAAGWLALGVCRAQEAPPGDGSVDGSVNGSRAVFGVTVVDNSGLEGKVYLIKPESQELPNFKKLKPKGSLYTSALNIPPRHFTEGFPGITDRFEWFAIDYTGRFWIEREGMYGFGLTSDDGSKLYIDDRLLIDNDGIHPAVKLARSARLTRGVHRIRVSYFQGPRDGLALVLEVAPPGERWRIFSTKEFRPANPEDWKDTDADAAGPPAQRRK